MISTTDHLPLTTAHTFALLECDSHCELQIEEGNGLTITIVCRHIPSHLLSSDDDDGFGHATYASCTLGGWIADPVKRTEQLQEFIRRNKVLGMPLRFNIGSPYR